MTQSAWSLLQDGALPLEAWLADPMDADQATRLLEAARARLLGGRCDERARLRARLAELVARFHLDRDVEADYLSLVALAGAQDGCEAARVELVYGQLLVSRRLARGWRHLDRGFRLGAGCFAPGAYFEVMKRHALLRLLPCGARPRPAADLDALVTEARVVKRLGGAPPPPAGRREDTLG